LVSPCDNDGSLDLSERKKTSEMEHDGLLNSSEINFVIDGNNYSSQPEERVWCFFLAFEMYATPFYFFFFSFRRNFIFPSFSLGIKMVFRFDVAELFQFQLYNLWLV
jgi:hypothetical protein